MKRFYFVLFFLLAIPHCVSLTESEKKAPKIHEKMPLNEALEAAINYGEDTFKAVKKLVTKRNEWSKAERLLFDNIMSHHASWSYVSLLNAVHLLQLSETTRGQEIVRVLIRADRENEVELGWHLASALPSAQMSQEIENRLTEALSENEVSEVLTPKMAEAVANNGLKSSYTLLRQGLMEKNNVAFARGMVVLDPKKASSDFLDYLALAPVEELRQLNLKTVDIFACSEILQHLLVTEVSVAHPHFDALFNFSISRNNGLAEMASKVLDSYFPRHSQEMALLLARFPPWMQVAFVERARTRMTPVVGVFLGDLRGISAQKEVIEEIDGVKSDYMTKSSGVKQ